MEGHSGAASRQDTLKIEQTETQQASRRSCTLRKVRKPGQVEGLNPGLFQAGDSGAGGGRAGKSFGSSELHRLQYRVQDTG